MEPHSLHQINEYLPLQGPFHQVHNLVLNLVKGLIDYVFLLKVVEHIAAKLTALFLEFPVKGKDVGGLITGPNGGVIDKGFGEGVDALWEFLVDGAMGDFFPHVFEVDFPLIILELGADFFNFLVNLFAIKVNLLAIELSIELIIKFLFKPGLKHIEQVTNLSLKPDNNLVDALSELPDKSQGLLSASDDLLVEVGGLLAFADGYLFELAALLVFAETLLQLEEQFVLLVGQDYG
jgi:hypothetical protein